MSLLSSASTSLARQCARQQLPALCSSSAAVQKRNRASMVDKVNSFKSPYQPSRGTSDHKDTTVIPSFKNYRAKGGETSNKVFQYFMVGTFGAVSALGAKATVQGMS